MSVARRLREGILSLYSALTRDPVWNAVYRSGAPIEKDMEMLEQVQKRAMKLIRGLEHQVEWIDLNSYLDI